MRNKDTVLNQKALKSGFIFIMMQMLVKGISFLSTPIYTRMLSPAQYGEVRVYESWLLMFAPIVALNLYRCSDQVKFEFGREKYYSAISSIQTLAYLSIASFSALILLFHQQAEKILDMSFPLLILMILFFFANASLEFMRRREKQMMHYHLNIVTTFCTMIPATMGSILWIYYGHIKNHQESLVLYRNLGFYLPQIIGGGIIAVIIWRQGKKLIDTAVWKYAVLFCIPLIPEMISIQIMNQSDKLMVKYLVGLKATGIYSLATTVSWIVWVLEDSVWNAWQPWMYEKISRNEYEDIETPWLYIMHGFGLLTWLLVMTGPEIIHLLGATSYQASVYLIAPLCVSMLYHFFNNSYSAIQSYYKKTKIVAATTVCAMVLNLVLNYIFIRIFGYTAAAYTTAFSYFALMVAQGIVSMKITKKQIIPLKKSIIISVFYFIVSVGSMFMYILSSRTRYMIIIIVMVVIVYYFRNNLRKLLLYRS